MRLDQLEDLLQAGLRLKGVKRTGWMEAGLPDPESVADHSYGVSLTTMVLSDTLGLDTLRALRMALLHDLAESLTGDIPRPAKGAGDEAREDEAMAELLGRLPETLRGLYQESWEEYRSQTTWEARLVEAADKLELAIQAEIYAGRHPGAPLESFRRERREAEQTLEELGRLKKATPRG